jgi:ATP-binding cassette subfamily B protein
VKLLCRLYDPTSGTITVDGIDLREFESAALSREPAVVFQDWAAYHVTACDSIWFGDPRSECDQFRIHQAAGDSGADEVSARLTRGYETVLGRWFEKGEELSMGEWQEVAGRSTILIRHRLSTDGRIVESGGHDDLLRRSGTYARLFETQAQSYR